ncbi:MAG: sulfatase-like hydrolase/transferase [Acidobacteria bacterium]|nr:sulfatase-like hydrolase/transferase [Acidobacteriota bacterium]
MVDQEFAMSGRVRTLAEHLRAGGWRTHAIVYKAALFGLGLEQGFDRWFNLPTSNRTAQVNLEKALAFLEAYHDRRFFLFLHLDDPHQPFNQPAPFDLSFGDSTAHDALDLELPISIRNDRIIGCSQCMQSRRLLPGFVKVAQDLYDGAIAYTDDRIGVLLDALAKHGIYEDTVVAVVADHGELIYDRGRAWGHPGAGLTDDQIRVPLILKGARGDSFEPGETVRAQVRTTDLLPTLLESAGLDGGPESFESRSLWPLVSGEETRDRVAFIESPAHGVLGLRTPAWKYVLRTRPSGQSHHSLYDLHSDPDERDNVARQRPSEIARLAEEMAPFILRTRPGPFLLVLGDGEPGAFQLVLEKDDEVGYRSFIGLPPTSAPRAADRDIAVSGRVLALIELDLAAGRAVRASLSSAGRTLISRVITLDQLESYAKLDLDRLSRQPTPAIYFLRGAPPIDPFRTAATTSLDQLEDLRALGYID